MKINYALPESLGRGAMPCALTSFSEISTRHGSYHQVPIILLGTDTPREAVCQVFEKVNQGGVALSVFDLITATYAADEFNLREDWTTRQKKLKQLAVLGNVQNTRHKALLERIERAMGKKILSDTNQSEDAERVEYYEELDN